MKYSIALFCLYAALSKCLLLAQSPYGMVKVTQNLFVDDTEITVNEYRQFLLQNPDRNDIAPDSAVWSKHLGGFIDALFTYYFNHPAFDNYPVVGVSYQQALLFCEWRTHIQNEFAKKQPIDSKKAIFYRYRLPTKAEWELIAKAKNEQALYAGGWENTKNKKGKYHFNFAPEEDGKTIYDKDGYYYVNSVKIKSFPASKNKIYGLAGNVAEMIQEEGITKGGSWHSPAAALLITSQEYYTTPTPWIGFRCFAEAYNPKDE